MSEEYKVININGVDVTCYNDGSVEREYRGVKRRQFGSNQSMGYKSIGIGGKVKLVHRVIAEAFLSDYSDSLDVDHINGDCKDNRLENLRILPRSQNSRAFAKRRVNSTSKYRGVSLCRARDSWLSLANIDGKDNFLGNYDDEEQAARSWDAVVFANGYLPEALNFSVRDAQKLLLCSLAVANK